MNGVATLAALSPENGLSRYLSEIRKFPLLTAAEEFTFAKRWRELGDKEAAYKLVTSHLRLVAKIAMRYRGYGLPIADVVAEGNVGLMHAVKRFEPERGFRLATYAMWWIRASIQEFILRSWSLVRISETRNQKRLFFKLRETKNKISALEDGDLQPEHVKLIAEQLDVREREVVEMNRRLAGDTSLNRLINDEGDERQDWLADTRADPETMIVEQEEQDLRQRALSDAIKTLNDRERRILMTRTLTDRPLRLEDLAAEFGVSRERIRQIELRALQKVSAFVKDRQGIAVAAKAA
jgi:RNA polymerase sigma-32 factor